MTFVPILNKALSLLTILSQAGIILLALALIFRIKNERFSSFFINKALLLAFIVALFATLGSLFYSELVNFEPCKLCWFARIFLFPQAIIFGIALYKKDRSVFLYGIGLSVIGMVVTGYHYLLQVGLAPNLTCASGENAVSCSQIIVREFGYITMPFMAFTTFLLLFTLSLLGRMKKP